MAKIGTIPRKRKWSDGEVEIGVVEWWNGGVMVQWSNGVMSTQRKAIKRNSYGKRQSFLKFLFV